MGMALRSGRISTTPGRAPRWQKAWEKANARFGARYTRAGVNMPALGKALGFGAITSAPKPTPSTTQAAASVSPAPAAAAPSPAIPDPLPTPAAPTPAPAPDPYKPSKTGEYQVARLSPTTGMRIGIEQ